MQGQWNITLPAPVETALRRLEEAGHEAYVVGGCTRDALLGQVPGDWDITTSALPEETRAVFSDCRIIDVGARHGTVAVRLDGMQLEITTYRVDGTYADSRHPDEVTFTRSLEEDLARRDFTMNAIAYSPTRGPVDLYGGAEDIRTRKIRCVGDPETRFTEDALRILRALRFSSVLGFPLEEKTSDAVHALKERIALVASERIAAELFKLLCGADLVRVLTDYRDVLAVVLPELEPCFDFDQHNPHHCYDVYTHSLKAAEAIAPVPELRLTMLLHDIGKPSTFFFDEKNVGHFYGHGKAGARMAAEIVRRLRLSARQQEEIRTLVEFHDYPLDPDRKILLRRLNKFGTATLQDLIRVQITDAQAQTPALAADRLDSLRTIEGVLEQLLREKPAFRVSDLEVDGEDLIALGAKPGPALGELLEELLRLVMEETLPNDRSALLDYVAERIK
ncbi:MAG: CCA tRNA nucleotidyltransferase [Clostridia bacterium]|nr:CCA tRNA nucleotidyltransferase [Clostridia bacterium]